MKMLARTAVLDASDVHSGPPAEQDIPLNVPKKTRLYVEQTDREREQAVGMTCVHVCVCARVRVCVCMCVSVCV
jgi:hypothetical protein